MNLNVSTLVFNIINITHNHRGVFKSSACVIILENRIPQIRNPLVMQKGIQMQTLSWNLILFIQLFNCKTVRSILYNIFKTPIITIRETKPRCVFMLIGNDLYVFSNSHNHSTRVSETCYWKWIVRNNWMQDHPSNFHHRRIETQLRQLIVKIFLYKKLAQLKWFCSTVST